MFLIALFAVVVISLSAHTERAVQAAEGFQAPAFSLTNDENHEQLTLADLKGAYALINFWSSMEPESRIAANAYTAFSRTAPARRMALVSINLDEDSTLFAQVAKHDGLDMKRQFHVDGPEARRLADAYNLDHRRLNSYLIDPQGKIIAVNPTRATLNALLGR